MQARVLGLDELTVRDLCDWRELAERALEPNPFFEPDFVLPAARWVARGRIFLLAVADADGWAACLPVWRTWRWRKLPLRTLAGWRHLYSYLGTPLVRSEHADRTLEALIGRATADRGTAAFVLDWLGDEGPVSSGLIEAVDARRHLAITYEAFDRAIVRRRAEPTYLAEAMSAKGRKELRRLERRLAESLGSEVDLVDRSGEAGGVVDFLDLEASGWKGRTGTAIGSSQRHRRFFDEVCSGFGRRGRVQVLALEGGEQTAAMQWNVRAGDAIFCLKVAYEEKLARYSPGAQLEARALDAFHATTGVNWIDSCAAPDNELISRLWPDRRRIASLVVARGGAAGRSTLFGFRTAAALRDRRPYITPRARRGH